MIFENVVVVDVVEYLGVLDWWVVRDELYCLFVFGCCFGDVVFGE